MPVGRVRVGVHTSRWVYSGDLFMYCRWIGAEAYKVIQPGIPRRSVERRLERRYGCAGHRLCPLSIF